jgi:hypothetical protein
MSGARVHRWNGGAWVDAPPDGISVRFEIGSNSAAWRVQLPRTLLDGSTAFDFQLVFAKWAGDEIAAADRAPDSGSWRYELALVQCANGRDDDGDGKVDGADRGCGGANDDVEGDETVTPQLVRPSVAPARAPSGRPIVVRARARALETGEPIATGSVVCTFGNGATRTRVTGRISAGLATCRLTAPRVSRPTTVRGTMTIAGTRHAVPFTFRAG